MDKMDLEREFHMIGGVGKTSYARNSSFQKKASDQAKDITLKTVQQLYKETRPKNLVIADLGCSSGPNTLSTIRDIIKGVIFAHQREIPNEPLPEFSIFLNDLPGNDFNSIFKCLPNFHIELKRDTKNDACPSVFIAAYPGSFYGRLFPENTIHFIYSSLRLQLLSKGEIEEEKLDSFEVHFYAPSAAEIEVEVNKEGSFELEKLEMLEVDKEWGNEDGISYGKAVAKMVRAVQESMLAPHFGEEILDKLFDTYGRIVDEELAKEDIKHITFVVVLRRKL